MGLFDTKQDEIIKFLANKYKKSLTEHWGTDIPSEEYHKILNEVDAFREGCRAMVEAVGLGRREWEEVARALGI